MTPKIYILTAIISLLTISSACRLPAERANVEGGEIAPRVNSNRSDEKSSITEASSPVLEVAPVSDGEGGYKLATGETLKLTVRAHGAEQVDLFFQPVTAADRLLKLRTLTAREANSAGEFVAEMKTPADFNGEIWAEAKYQNGQTRETARLRIASFAAAGQQGEKPKETRDTAQNQPPGENAPTRNKSGEEMSSDDDDSLRSDKKTGGKIERARLQPRAGEIRISVNVPAFLLTLWQNGQEIETYYVGVGRKQYPIPIGMREAKEIILNPDWIPPDSSWVRKSGIEPYERIPASDPDNPLGKIKIPLGQAYLLHEAQGPQDLGNLVSHGCVRVLRDDIFDLTKKVVAARGLDISPEEINAARKNSARRAINLGEAMAVDINYDTMVVEEGVLYLFPDVYDRKTNTVENLKSELLSYDLESSVLDSETLEKMLGKVNDDRKFVVPLSAIRAGKALTAGKVEPLTPQQAKKKNAKK